MLPAVSSITPFLNSTTSAGQSRAPQQRHAIVEVTDRANEREERTTEWTIEWFTPVIQGWDLTPGESFGQHLIIDCEAPPPKPESKAG